MAPFSVTLLSLALLIDAASGFGGRNTPAGILRQPAGAWGVGASRRAGSQPPRTAGTVARRMSDMSEDEEQADLKQRLKQRDAAEFNARKAELDGLRERIRKAAADQNVEEATPWMPDMPKPGDGKTNPNAPPEMTGPMGNLAKALGDDRLQDEDELDGSEWEDPLEGLPQWKQLYEESKTVEWPSPGKVATNTLYVYMGMIGSTLFVVGCDKLFFALGEALGFVYGVNPDFQG